MTGHAEPENAEEPADRLDAAELPVADAPAIPESLAPMLDVHAPHEGIHTWKNFFVHIATIVIGLLIAVGLEQTVEYFHHRHQVAEVRESLRVERRNRLLQPGPSCVTVVPGLRLHCIVLLPLPPRTRFSFFSTGALRSM